MKEFLEQEFNCQVLECGEWGDDAERWSAFVGGRMVAADSLPLFILALTDARHTEPVYLGMAA